MATFVYRRQASTGATDLAQALGATRYRAINLPMERKVRPGDTVICWGESLVPIDGVRILNGGQIRDKYQDARRLSEAGVPTIKVSQTKPEPEPPTPAGPDPAFAAWERASEIAESFVNADSSNPVSRGPVMVAAVNELHAAVARLMDEIRKPIPVATPGREVGEWLPRLRNHVGGNDLFTPPATPDFYVKKESIVQEYRIHSFQGRSIRAGVKRQANDVPTVHPWIRSFDGGWRIVYDGVTPRQKHRDVAHAACKALELDFAAVDVAELADGTVIVLECNRAPGIEAGTITNYTEAIRKWIDGVTTPRDVEAATVAPPVRPHWTTVAQTITPAAGVGG